MAQIEISDQIFDAVRQRATDFGFSSVDEYVAEVLTDELAEEDYSYLFTPERIAELDRISAEIDAGGKMYSMQEVEQHFEEKRKTWLENHPT